MKHLFYLPAFLVFASVSVHAQDTQPGQTPTDPSQQQQGQGGFGESQPSGQLITDFNEADKDGDGYLSMEEAREAVPQDVTIADTDGDGLLSKSEVESAMPNVSFEQSLDSPSGEYIGEEEYDQIVQSIEQGGAQQGV